MFLRYVSRHSSKAHSDVLLICPAPQKAAISHYIHSDSSVSSFPSLRIDLQIYDETIESGQGTCDVLRQFANRIKQDFVVVPCDFVPSPSFNLSIILDKFRTETTYDGSIATACFFEAPKQDKNAVIEEWGMLPPPLPVVWDNKTGTLLHVDSPDDFDHHSEDLQVTMSLLTRYLLLWLLVILASLKSNSAPQLPSCNAVNKFPRCSCVCVSKICSRCATRKVRLRVSP